MGNNTSKYDMDAEYSKKSLSELQKIKLQYDAAIERHPEMKSLNEHLGYVKMKIAERVGKKK